MAEDFYILKGGLDEEDGEWYFGRARLVIVTEFTNLKNHTMNYDFNVDVNAIRTSLKPFKIKVDDPIMNPTAKQLIKCFKEKIDYFGCAIIFIFSRGEQDHIWCSDYDEQTGKGKLNVWNDFYPYFSGDENEELKKCPKVFFNEWCQDFSETSTKDFMNNIDSDFHSTAHWLIYNAAQPGYETPVHEENGSYSLQAFCRRLREFGQTKDLHDIFTLVKEDTCKIRVGADNFLQPMTYSSLVKKLYLLPEEKVYQFKSNYQKKFKQIRLLGEGSFGVVFEVKSRVDGMKYAVKRLQFTENVEKISTEFKFLAKLTKCLRIVGYYDAWIESAEFDFQRKEDRAQNVTIELTKNRSSNMVQFCYIQMELCGATLEQWLKEKSQRDIIESVKLFKQIVEGLAHLHKNNIVHRDIKPSNILFAINNKDSGDLSVRIADLGLARHVGNCSTLQVAGTLLYMAPEMALKKCDAKWDMFSAGLILIELLHSCSGANHDDLLLAAKFNEFPEPFHNELKFALPVLKQLLSFKPSERPTSDELLNTLRNDPDWNEDLLTKRSNEKQNKDLQISSKEEFKLESTCTSTEHEVNEKNEWTTSVTKMWKGEKSYSEWSSLPAVRKSAVQWEVCFTHWSNDDFAVNVRCQSQDKHFLAAAYRLFAVVEENPQIWTEDAAVVKSGEVRESCFSTKFCELTQKRPINIRVKVKWTELDQLPFIDDLWKDDAACISCHWQLRGLRNVRPTAECWSLYSERFGRSGALWRIIVGNRSNENGR